MADFVLSPAARQDVFDIWLYLAQEAGVEFAEQVETELFGDFELLARNPGLGHRRRDLTDSDVFLYRAFPYRYMIVYRRHERVEIVSVLHGRRDLKRILSERGP